MSVDYDELSVGYEFPATSYELDAPLVSRYLKAVDSPGDDHVPPLVVAARALAAMSGCLSLPGGTIHASQEFEFFKLVSVGSTVECRARVTRKLARGSMRMLVLQLDVFDQTRERVQSGKATIILPA